MLAHPASNNPYAPDMLPSSPISRSPIRERIRSAAPHQSVLVTALRETEYASEAIIQAKKYMRDSQEEMEALKPMITQRYLKTQKERVEHHELQKSHVTKFAYTITGQKEKFKAKATKEEREYFEALQEEAKDRSRLEVLETIIRETEANLRQLDQVAAKHAWFQAELDSLYNEIFGGYTPEFPEEDALESHILDCLRSLEVHTAHRKIIHDTHTHLRKAANTLASVTQLLNVVRERALRPQPEDSRQRTVIASAQQSAATAESYLNKAQAAYPNSNPFATGPNPIEDFLLDDICGTAGIQKYWQKIRFHSENLKNGKQTIHSMILQLEQEKKNSEKEVKEAEILLLAGKGKLERFRTEIFQSVVEGRPVLTVRDQNLEEAPPEYN